LKKIFFIILLFSVGLFALPQAIATQIRSAGLASKDVSIYIKEVGKRGKVVVSHNASKSRSPASVIKVLSTYASLLKLGYDYRFETRFYYSGYIKKGILHGDLIVKGFGDPSLRESHLSNIVAKIKNKGIRKIRGNIIIDRSYFRVGSKNTSGFDENTYSAYNAMPDALMFNERVSTICVSPQKQSAYPKYHDKSYQIINQLKHVNKPCKGRYSWPGIKIDNSQTTPRVFLKGQISKRCGKRNICKVISKPYKTFYYALKAKLKSKGIAVSGTLKLKKVPRSAKKLFTHYSATLEKIIAKTAKKSNNLYARHLLLTLGAKVYGAPATIQKGRDAVAHILRQKGALRRGETLMIDNGSGLSRISRLSAKLLASMYDHAHRYYGQRWMNTLSIAGVDGTIKRRFRGTVVRKRAWMKTGTLRHVKNIGGYVKDKRGKLYTVVILVNSPKTRYRAAKLQNDIIKWLVKGGLRGQSAIKEKKEKPQVNFYQAQGKKYFYIQVASSENLPSASYLRKIKHLGLKYSIRHSDRYKVLIGAYKYKESAQRALHSIRQKLSSGAFIVEH